MIRVLLVDDHDLVRHGLVRILQDQGDIEVVGEAGSVEEALRLLRSCAPHLVIMDLNLPGMSGVEGTDRIIRYNPEVRVIVLTMHAQNPYPQRLLEVGASGFLTKGCAAEELVAAVRAVARGRRYLDANVAQHMALGRVNAQEESPFERLTSRELEVALGLARGDSAKVLAANLNLSPKTVSTHKARVFDKLEVHSVVELNHLAIRFGLIKSLPGTRIQTDDIDGAQFAAV